MENTKVCKYCKEKVNKSAQLCPHCRKRLKISGPQWAAVCFIAIIVLTISYYSALPDDHNADIKAANRDIQTANTYFKNN